MPERIIFKWLKSKVAANYWLYYVICVVLVYFAFGCFPSCLSRFSAVSILFSLGHYLRLSVFSNRTEVLFSFACSLRSTLTFWSNKLSIFVNSIKRHWTPSEVVCRWCHVAHRAGGNLRTRPLINMLPLKLLRHELAFQLFLLHLFGISARDAIFLAFLPQPQSGFDN